MKKTGNALILKESNKNSLTNAGVSGSIKIFATPLAKDQFYLRVENIADLYDKTAKTQYVDIKRIIYHFWEGQNDNLPFVTSDWEVVETSLTGNMPLSELQSRKVQWKTEDDTDTDPEFYSTLDYKSGFGFSLYMESQRIRAFKVTHNNHRRVRRSLALSLAQILMQN